MPRLLARLPIAVLCVTALLCVACRPRPTASHPRMPVSVQSSLDRTAAWVGDLVTYTVEVVCSPGYDIADEDLARDRLPLDGLELRAADTAREVRDDGTVLHRARFQLASYTPERESLRIGPMSIRYYQRRGDGGGSERVSAGSVEVPAENIALRSTLPESIGKEIRTATSPVRLPWLVHLLFPLGLVVAALPAVAIGIGLAIRARRQQSAQADAQEAQRPPDYHVVLDDIGRLGADANPEAVREAFGRLDALLRRFLADSGIDAGSLTPDEIDVRAGDAAERTPPRAAAEVLRACERARYAGPRQPPSRDRLAHALGEAQTAVAGRHSGRAR